MAQCRQNLHRIVERWADVDLRNFVGNILAVPALAYGLSIAAPASQWETYGGSDFFR
jgi:hypothetical protein